MIVLPRRSGIVHRSAVFIPLVIFAFIVTGCATTAKPPALAQLPAPQWAQLVPAYAIGSVAMFWLIQRVAAF